MLDAILPIVGACRPKGLPIWDPDRQMFLLDEHESKSGHRSYKGVRVTDRFMTVEYVSNYYTCTYINAIELYVYDGKELKLAGKKEFDKCFYNRQEIRSEHESLMAKFLQAQVRMLNRSMDAATILQTAKEQISNSYMEMSEANVAHMMKLAVPMLPQSKYLDY